METQISKSKAGADYRVGKGTLMRITAGDYTGVVRGTDRSGMTIQLLYVADLEARGPRRRMFTMLAATSAAIERAFKSNRSTPTCLR